MNKISIPFEKLIISPPYEVWKNIKYSLNELFDKIIEVKTFENYNIDLLKKFKLYNANNYRCLKNKIKIKNFNQKILNDNNLENPFYFLKFNFENENEVSNFLKMYENFPIHTSNLYNTVDEFISKFKNSEKLIVYPKTDIKISGIGLLENGKTWNKS